MLDTYVHTQWNRGFEEHVWWESAIFYSWLCRETDSQCCGHLIYWEHRIFENRADSLEKNDNIEVFKILKYFVPER